MILDWNTQCKKIHKLKKLSRDDPSDNKRVFSQEAHYVKYLMIEGCNQLQIYDHWRKLKNGTASVFKDDPDLQVSMFAKIFKSGKEISAKVFEQHYEPIKIYKTEIQYLNSVKAPVWVKQYWLSMLIYWKFASQHAKTILINTTLCNWAMKHADIKNQRYGRHQDEIAQYNKLENGYVLSTGIAKKQNGRNFWFDWIKPDNEGEFIEVESLDKIKKPLKLITGNYKICPKCGKRFAFGGKSKTELCPVCYAEERKATIRNNSKKYYHTKKADKI